MEIKIPYYEDKSRISRSFLNWFNISPRYAKDMLDGKIEQESKSVFEAGIMKHMYILQPNEFKDTYRILDFTTPTSAQQKKFCQDYIDSKAKSAILKAAEAFKLNYSTSGKSDEDIGSKGLEMALKLKSYIKWLRENTAGRKSITWAKLNDLKKAKENIQLHKKAKELLYSVNDSSEVIAENEFHINWTFKTRDGVEIDCKSLLDRLIIDKESKTITLIDLKTTSSNSTFSHSFKEYGYDMQLAFYWMAIYYYVTKELGLDVSDFKAKSYIVTIENGSNEVKVFSIPEDLILSETYKIEKQLNIIGWHIINNKWDYSKEYYEGDGAELLTA